MGNKNSLPLAASHEGTWPPLTNHVCLGWHDHMTNRNNNHGNMEYTRLRCARNRQSHRNQLDHSIHPRFYRTGATVRFQETGTFEQQLFLEQRLRNLESYRQNLVEERNANLVSRQRPLSFPPPPPASSRVIRHLDKSSRQRNDDDHDNVDNICYVCWEPKNSRVTCLPCGHSFHINCIKPWLTRQCTCPVCRYELETDDPRYERERAQRMQSRRAHVAN